MNTQLIKKIKKNKKIEICICRLYYITDKQTIMDIVLDYMLMNNKCDMIDISVLSCVSLDFHRKTSSYFLDNNERALKVFANTMNAIGIKQLSDYTNCKVGMLDICGFISFLCKLKHLYVATPTNKTAKSKFLDNIKLFTREILPKTFISLKCMPWEIQIDTIKFLLDLCSSEHHGIQVLCIYTLYYFLHKLCTQNNTKFKENPFCCILGDYRIREQMMKTTHNFSSILKNEVSYYPYAFITKMLKLFDLVKYNLAKL